MFVFFVFVAAGFDVSLWAEFVSFLTPFAGRERSRTTYRVLRSAPSKVLERSLAASEHMELPARVRRDLTPATGEHELQQRCHDGALCGERK